jgi:hypothetical protein
MTATDTLLAHEHAEQHYDVWTRHTARLEAVVDDLPDDISPADRAALVLALVNARRMEERARKEVFEGELV